MDDILKILLDYGLTGGSLAVLSYVVLQQMKLLSKMEERMARSEVKIDRLLELNEDSLGAMRHCQIRSEYEKSKRK